METSIISIAIEPTKKENVAKILARFGLNHSQAINLFYNLIEEHNDLPFVAPTFSIEESVQVRPEVMNHLADSIEKNGRLGELLAQ